MSTRFDAANWQKIPKLELDRFSPTMSYKDIHDRAHKLYDNRLHDTSLGAQVKAWLNDDPRVKSLVGKAIRKGNSTMGFCPEALARWFLWYTNEESVDKAEIALEAFLSSEKIQNIKALWITGISLKVPIHLENGYSILPISDMPDSREKERFTQIGGHRSMGYSMLMPSVAIVCNHEVTKIANADGIFGDLSEDIIWQLHDIALLLNAVSNVVALPYVLTDYNPPSVPFGLFGGSGSSFTVYDVVGDTITELTQDHTADIIDITSGFSKLDKDEKNRFRTFLGRLSQAKRRSQIEDKMLDLGIALEMLLLNNSKKEQLALTFRLRGSWLLSATTDERIANAKILKDIYQYRCDVAHSGILQEGNAKKIQAISQNFFQYQSLAEQICRKMLKNPKPNWDELILGVL